MINHLHVPWRLQKLRQQGIGETVWVKQQHSKFAKLYLEMLYEVRYTILTMLVPAEWGCSVGPTTSASTLL